MAVQAPVKNSPIALAPAARFAWSAYRQHTGLFIVLLLAMFGAWAVLEVAVIAGQRLGLLWWAAAHLAFLVIFAGLEAGFVHVCLALRDGGQPALADGFRRLRLGPKFLVAQLLYLLTVAVGFGLLLLPGPYFAGRYALVGFRLIDGQPRLPDSFYDSARLTANSATGLGALWAGLLLFNVLGAAVLGLGLLITVPLSVLLLADVYRQLSPR